MAGSSRAASAGRGGALPVINRTRLPPLPPLPPLSKMISIYYTRRKDTEKIQQNASKIAKICCFLAPQGTCGANVGCGLFQYPRKSRKYFPYFPRKSPNFENFQVALVFTKKGAKIRWRFEGSLAASLLWGGSPHCGELGPLTCLSYGANGMAGNRGCRPCYSDRSFQQVRLRAPHRPLGR